MRQKLGLGYVLATCLGLVIQVSTANAGVITHTSRADFDAATGATIVEDFNSFTTEVDFRTDPLDVGDFTISTTSPSLVRNFIEIPPFQFTQLGVDGTNIINALVSSGVSLSLTFDAPITAFGADFGQINDGFIRTEILAGGETFVPPVGGSNEARFFGFTSDTAFTTVEFVGLENDGFGIDNVTFAPAVSGVVPEPTSIAIFGALALVTTSSRRRRK